MYPQNDWRSYLEHSAKGTHWKEHKYIRIEGDRYIYPEDLKRSRLGRYGRGNIDLFNRPILQNSDGSISTVESFSTNIDGLEVLLPTIARDSKGRAIRISEDQAIDNYYKTGKYLGKFKTVKEADDYAKALHDDQDRVYGNLSKVPKNGSGGKYAVVGRGGKEHARTNSLKNAIAIAKTRHLD